MLQSSTIAFLHVSETTAGIANFGASIIGESNLTYALLASPAGGRE